MEGPYLPGMPSIHQRIKERREALGLTKEQLASELGVSYQAVQQWEKEPVPGDTSSKVKSTAPSRRRLEQVARVLRCTPEWLLTGHMPNAGDMTPEEAMRFDMYRKLPENLRESILAQIDAMYNALYPGKPHPADPTQGRKPPRPD